MIRPPGFGGAAFSSASDGDLRRDETRRARFSRELEISADWATVAQVHGRNVVEARIPGELSSADGLFTRRRGLPIAVFVADCVPVVLEGEGAVGIAHAGWRGLAAAVVTSVREAMADAGVPAERAAIGPAIGPCCYEVGRDVLNRFSGFEDTTTSGAPSVDLSAAAAEQLAGLPITQVGGCTHHGGGFSHRRDRTEARQAAVAWIP